jgi:hypothetical protein
LRVGIVNLPDVRVVCVFNWEDQPQTIQVPLPRPTRTHPMRTRPTRVTDFWTGEELGRREGSLTIHDLPSRTAKLLVCN